MKRHPVFAALAALTLLLAGQLGCKKKGGSEEAEASNAAAAPTSNRAVPTETPVLSGLDALALLPADVATVGAVDGIGPWLERVGWDALRADQAEALAGTSKLSSDVLSHDFLDPATLGKIGVDASRPVGFAAWASGGPAAAAFVPLTDSAKLLAWLEGLPKDDDIELRKETLGDATLVSVSGFNGAALLVRSDWALLVGARNGVSVARELATLKREDSLAANERLDGALAGLAYGQQAAVFVDLEATAELVGVFAGFAEARILAVEMLGKQATLALGGAVTGDAVLVSGVLGLDRRSPLRPLLKASKGTPTIVRITKDRPLQLVHISLDPKAVFRAVRKVASKAGAPFDEALSALKEATGFDPEALDKLITGEAAIAVTGDLTNLDDASVRQDDLLISRIGGTALIGIVDEARIKALIETVLTLAPKRMRERVTGGNGTWRVDVEDFKPVTVTLGNGYLAIGTDAAAVEALSAGDRAFTGGLEGERLKAVLGAEDVAVLAAVDVGTWMNLLVGTHSAESRPSDEMMTPASDPEVEAKRAEWLAKRKELHELRKTLDDAERARIAGVFGPMGYLAGHARVSRAGYEGTAGFFLRGVGVEAWLGTIMRAIVEQETIARVQRNRSYELSEQVWKLQAETRRLIEMTREARPALPQAAPPR